MIRALFLTKHLRVGGAQRNWTILLPALAERGFDPRLLTLEHEGELFDELRASGVGVACAGVRGKLDPRLLRVGHELGGWRPDVVVSHDERSHVVARRLARRAGVPHVAADHGGPGFRLKSHGELILRLVAPGFDAAVTMSERRVPDLVRRGFRADGLHVIANGLDPAALRVSTPRETSRAEFGLRGDHFVALLLAVLRPEKRADRFVRAVAHANAVEPRLRGLVAGYGPEEAAVRRLASEHGDSVAVLGHRGDVAELIESSDAVCLTSDVEGAPYAAAEAMALAKPVVAMRAGSLDELVVDGETGVLVPAGDEQELAAALVALARDPARARALGAAGRERQAERFGAKRMCDAYAAVLRALALERRGGRVAVHAKPARKPHAARAPISVVFATNELGIGGTERGMTTQALALDREAFDVRVVALDGSGPQREAIEQAGLSVSVGDGRLETLTALLRGADIVVQLRPGAEAPLLPAACRQAGVAHVVDWNIFGQVDRSPDQHAFACHLFISMTMQLRYRSWVGGGGPGFHELHRVHYLPVDPALRRLAPDRAQARRLLGLDPDRPVVGRTGRAVDIKWRSLLVDMIPGLLRAVPNAQLVLVGATPGKVRRLRRLGVLDSCTLLEPTLDQARLAAFYAACDVFVSASEIGEAQGLANLEAMSFGVPVVTCSMPWADNAQVEFVEHGRTGLIANHPRPFAEAVASLLLDPELRRRLGSEAAGRVARRCDPSVQARQLERLFASLLSDGRPPEKWTPSSAEVEAFESEYARRTRLQFRPLRRRERFEAEATRLRERMARAARA